MNTLAFLKSYTPSRFIHQKLEKKRPEGLVFILVINALIGVFLAFFYTGGFFFPLTDGIGIFLNFFTYLLAGIVYSVVRYFCFGGIFHLLILLAGGKKSYLTSINIFLFSRLPANLFALFVLLYQFISWMPHLFIPHLSFAILFLGTALAQFYSFALIYKSAREKQKTKPIRSILFFIIIPALYILLTVLPVPLPLAEYLNSLF